MASTESPADIAKLRDAIFLDEQARAVSPDLTILRTRHFRAVPLQNVQAVLNPSEVVLEYVVAEPNSYVLVFTRDSRRIVKLTGRKEIEKLVAAYTAAVKQAASARQEARNLYEALLAPIPEIQSHSHYLVVPDGSLNLVPFDALIDEHDQFVVEAHVTAYEPSCTTLYLLRSTQFAGKPPNGLLSVGGVPYQSTANNKELSPQPYSPDRRLEDLPNSAAEADIAAAELKSSHNKQLEGAAATESHLKMALAEGYEYVHLAGHAVTSDDPDRAALVVLSDPSHGEDGFVQASEIVQMHLRTNLVVLSACDTNVGPIQGEEGISALSTAFLLAGAKTVVSTLWPIEDKSSLVLMKDFYQHLGAGQSVAEALAGAKRDVLTKYGAKSAPLHWAAYVVQGAESNGFARQGTTLTSASVRVR
jgi:CHAT domain-containing protein